MPEQMTRGALSSHSVPDRPWYLTVTIESGNTTMVFRAPGAKEIGLDAIGDAVDAAIDAGDNDALSLLCAEVRSAMIARLLAVTCRVDGVEIPIADREEWANECGLFDGTAILPLVRLVMFRRPYDLRIRGGR